MVGDLRSITFSLIFAAPVDYFPWRLIQQNPECYSKLFLTEDRPAYRVCLGSCLFASVVCLQLKLDEPDLPLYHLNAHAQPLEIDQTGQRIDQTGLRRIGL